MSDIDLIKRRFAELDIALAQEIARHKECVAAIEAESQELKFAQRVLARLSGEKTDDFGMSGAAHKMIPDAERSAPITELIVEALSLVEFAYPDGVAPKEITMTINGTRPKANVQPISISTTCWRMAKDGRLEKNGSLYRLPKKKAADPTSVEDGSTALNSISTQAREGGAGGGA